MKRKGETFTEFLTAIAVFGVIIAGVFEFMANQTKSLADIRDRDNLLFQAQRFMAVSDDETLKDSDYSCRDDEISFTFSKDAKILTVKNNNASMTFSLKP